MFFFNLHIQIRHFISISESSLALDIKCVSTLLLSSTLLHNSLAKFYISSHQNFI